jgi:allantoin racemase
MTERRRILYLTAVKGEPTPVRRPDLEALVGQETAVYAAGLARGPRHLEYHYYEALVVPDLIHAVKRAEHEGFDAAVIGCFYDLGLQEAREIVEGMPVTAPCESSVLIACSLGHRFSVVVGRRKWIPQMHDTVVRYGLAQRLASFRAVDLGVPQFHADEAETARRLRAAGRRAVEEDGAEVVILGCTAARGFFRELQEELGVPVLDAQASALAYADFLATLRRRFGWAHSKIGAYASPPLDEIAGWALEAQYGVRGLWRAAPHPVA